MRALQQTALAGPSRMHLITDAPVPTAGPGEVLIRVTVALVDGEFDEDLVAAGAPVRDFSGRIVAALNVSAPAYRLQGRLPAVGQHVLAAAARLSRAIAGAPEPDPSHRTALHQE